MKVKMVNTKVSARTTFELTIKKPGRSVKTVRTFKVRKDAVKKLKRPIAAPVGTTFVLRAVVVVTKAGGTTSTKKIRITTNKIRLGTSGRQGD